MPYPNYPSLSDLVGKTISSITGCEKHSDEILIKCTDGTSYKLYHSQDYCETVCVEDIIGDFKGLIGSPITMAEEVTGETPADFDASNYESYKWTYYKFTTVKGYLDIRWLGSSNGYYSESVTFDYA